MSECLFCFYAVHLCGNAEYNPEMGCRKLRTNKFDFSHFSGIFSEMEGA